MLSFFKPKIKAKQKFKILFIYINCCAKIKNSILRKSVHKKSTLQLWKQRDNYTQTCPNPNRIGLQDFIKGYEVD